MLDFDFHPRLGACFGVPVSSQPPAALGKGVGRSAAPQQQQQRQRQQHRILGSQSREKNHIPCGPRSSKFFHVTAKLSETLEKIAFTFPRVSLATGAGAAVMPIGSPRSRGWFSVRFTPRWGDEEYYPTFSAKTMPAQEGFWVSAC